MGAPCGRARCCAGAGGPRHLPASCPERRSACTRTAHINTRKKKSHFLFFFFCGGLRLVTTLRCKYRSSPNGGSHRQRHGGIGAERRAQRCPRASCPHPGHRGLLQGVTGGNAEVCLPGWLFCPQNSRAAFTAPGQLPARGSSDRPSGALQGHPPKALNLHQQKSHHLISQGKQVPGCPGARRGISHPAPHAAARGFSLLRLPGSSVTRWAAAA